MLHITGMRSILPKEIPNYQSREEYLTKLNKWVDEARLWHDLCTGNYDSYKEFITTAQNPVQTHRVQVVNSQYQEYIIPPIWKRVVAELLDFCFLLFIKILITFIVLQFLDIDVENYAMRYLKKIQNPKNVLRLSAEIIALEIIYRLFVCFYEAYWTSSYPCATPGKKYMGLKIIYVEHISTVRGNSEEIVIAYPGAPLGFIKALLRAFFKNVFVGLILPICFVVLFFKYNRTGYDVICNSLVVECNPNQLQRPNQ